MLTVLREPDFKPEFDRANALSFGQLFLAQKFHDRDFPRGAWWQREMELQDIQLPLAALLGLLFGFGGTFWISHYLG